MKLFRSLALPLLLVLCTTMLKAADKPSPGTVTIDNFMFNPVTVEVQRGTTVTWVNKDDIPHVVASTSNKFRSHAIDTDGTFTFTFTEPGTYEYFCSVHPKMTGKIVVK